MFNWVVKVVPQPSNAPDTLGEETPNAPPAAENKVSKDAKAKPVKPEEEASEENSAQSGVLSWFSNGFTNSLPQPTGTPRLSRANSDAREGERNTVIGWIAQGIEMVVPQPDSKYKATDEETTEVPEVRRAKECIAENCVFDAEDLPDAEPLPHIPVVEVSSDDEEEEESVTQFPPKVVNWIKHGIEKALPQPVMPLPPGFVEVNTERSSVYTGIDYSVKSLTLDNTQVAMQLWDTAGQERYRSITKQFFRRADGVVIMYDVTVEKSFKAVRPWLANVHEAAGEGIPILLLGNKMDIVGEREVKFKDAEILAQDTNVIFYEVSAYTGTNVTESMVHLARVLKEQEDRVRDTTVLLEALPLKKKACCN